MSGCRMLHGLQDEGMRLRDVLTAISCVDDSRHDRSCPGVGCLHLGEMKVRSWLRSVARERALSTFGVLHAQGKELTSGGVHRVKPFAAARFDRFIDGSWRLMTG